MILVPVFAVIMADNLRKIFVFMAILLSFDAVYVLSGGNGVMTGATFDAAVMAVFIATMVVGISAEKRGKLLYLALIPMVGVILTQDGGAAIMALLACGLWNAARLRGLRARLIVLAATVGVALAGYLTQGAGLYSSPGRLRMWAAYMDWWLANASPWFGAGPGSFNWIGPLTFMDEYQYYWMHNDWLQILFEYGIIGLALSLAILVKLLRSKDPRIQTFTVGVAAVMCFYSPLHLIPVQLLICLCILVSN
jgi:O-antigen ligase